MKLVLERAQTGSSTIEALAEIERDAVSYFTELLEFEQGSNTDLSTVLKFSLSVKRDRWTADNTITLDTTVDLVYRSESGRPLLLDTFLENLVEKNNVISNIEFNGYIAVSMLFEPVQDESKILFVEPDGADGRSGADKGLIVATTMLSVILIVVSSVLLYITGGWDAIQQALTNCLFEEVEEDDEHYLARSKSTFQVNSTDEDDDKEEGDENEEEEEEGPFETVNYAETEEEGSTIVQPQLTPSGNLGAMPVTQGLGIKTPMHGEMSGITELTPDASALTDANGNPLGITSMRKMPKNETPPVHGGLSHMIMKRLNNKS